MSVTNRPDCELCREVWEDQDQKPPCDTCYPGIHEYNYPILKLYEACEGQYITGPTGVIGLNDLAITNSMNEYFEVEKKDKKYLSLKVRSLASQIINLYHKAR